MVYKLVDAIVVACWAKLTVRIIVVMVCMWIVYRPIRLHVIECFFKVDAKLVLFEDVVSRNSDSVIFTAANVHFYTS